jgi:hypothetical protein
MYEDKPCHDWSSHGADSFRYLCQGIIAFIDGQATKAANLPRTAEHNYNPLREKAIRMEQRELLKVKKRKENRVQQPYINFAQTSYDIYNF